MKKHVKKHVKKQMMGVAAGLGLVLASSALAETRVGARSVAPTYASARTAAFDTAARHMNRNEAVRTRLGEITPRRLVTLGVEKRTPAGEERWIVATRKGGDRPAVTARVTVGQLPGRWRGVSDGVARPTLELNNLNSQDAAPPRPRGDSFGYNSKTGWPWWGRSGPNSNRLTPYPNSINRHPTARWAKEHR